MVNVSKKTNQLKLDTTFSGLSAIEKINIIETMVIKQLMKTTKNKGVDITKTNTFFNKNLKLLLDIIKLRLELDENNNTALDFDYLINIIND